MDMEGISKWAYVLFVAIAIVAGLVLGYMAWDGADVAAAEGYVLIIMLILSIVIGLTSITTKEVTPFLIATIALLVAAGANVWSPLGEIHMLLWYWADSITSYIVAFAAPAAVIISVKSVFGIAKD